MKKNNSLLAALSALKVVTQLCRVCDNPNWRLDRVLEQKPVNDEV